MRVLDLTRTSWQRTKYAIGKVLFAPNGSLVAELAKLENEWCVNPQKFRRVNLQTYKFRSETQRNTVNDYWTLSGDGQFVMKATPWHESAVTVEAWRLWGKIGLRGWELAPWGDSCDWLATAPDGRLYAAVTRGGVNGPIRQTDLLRLTVPVAPRTFVLVGGATSWIRVQNAISDDSGTFEVLGKVSRVLRYDALPAFTADSRRLVAWPAEGPALLLDADTGQTLREFPWKGPETDKRWHHRVTIAPKGERVALWGGGKLRCHSCDGTGKPWWGAQSLGFVTDAVFLPDGHSLLVVDRAGRVSRLDSVSGKVLSSWDWDLGMLLSVAVNADASLAATGAVSGKLVVWDLDA
jgi:hypothetical protein